MNESNNEAARSRSGAYAVPPGIAEEIAGRGGRVTFAQFMELALTHPTEGYYSRSGVLLGPRGHFSTAPRLAPAFNQSVGRLLEDLVDAGLEAMYARAEAEGAPKVAVAELGGGEGDLARAVLERWATRRPDLLRRVRYTIVEIGEQLRAKQRESLRGVMKRGWQVEWAGTIEEALGAAEAAVVVGNEFIDALPVHLVDLRGEEPVEAWVKLGRSETGRGLDLREEWGALSDEAAAELQALGGTLKTDILRPLTEDGIIELRPGVGDLVARLASGGRMVCLLTIDYGDWFVEPAPAGVHAPDTGQEWRLQGLDETRILMGGEEATDRPPVSLRRYVRTLRGYFKHQRVADPYLRVGKQDLTADVDFRALDVHGRTVGFETVLFATVADLLRADGGVERLSALKQKAAALHLGADREATVLEALLDARGLGGAYKVMLQVKE